MPKMCTAARALGLASLFAVAVVGALGRNHAMNGTDSGSDSTAGKMNYSITGIEVLDAVPGPGFGKVAVIRWHAINNSVEDIYAVPHLKVYQNKQVLHPGAAGNRIFLSEKTELAPGGQAFGTSIYRINDMSPITVKISDPHGESNELNESFYLER